jgi:hypothetical protein
MLTSAVEDEGELERLPFVASCSVQDDPEKIADQIRESLHLPASAEGRPSSAEELFKFLRAAIEIRGAANNILVLDYENVQTMVGSIYVQQNFIPTPAGYAQMDQVVTQAIATLNTPLQGGYLQNELLQNGDWMPEANVNTWSPGAQIQFTAVGYYPGGVIYPPDQLQPRGCDGHLDFQQSLGGVHRANRGSVDSVCGNGNHQVHIVQWCGLLGVDR